MMCDFNMRSVSVNSKRYWLILLLLFDLKISAKIDFNEMTNGSQFHDSILGCHIIYRTHHYLNWLLPHLLLACVLRLLVLYSQMFLHHLNWKRGSINSTDVTFSFYGHFEVNTHLNYCYRSIHVVTDGILCLSSFLICQPKPKLGPWMVVMVLMAVTSIRDDIARPHNMGDRLIPQFPFAFFRHRCRQISDPPPPIVPHILDWLHSDVDDVRLPTLEIHTISLRLKKESFKSQN